MTPVISDFKKAPKYLPIHFYIPEWFNRLFPGQKRLTSDAAEVDFLPEASQSLLPTIYPDEKQADARFSGKYLEVLKQLYSMSD